MAGEWQKLALGDLTEWSSGGTPPKSNPEFWGGDIPWISASSMKTGRLSESDRTLTPEGLKRGSRLARKGNVLLLVRGSELHKRIPGPLTRTSSYSPLPRASPETPSRFACRRLAVDDIVGVHCSSDQRFVSGFLQTCIRPRNPCLQLIDFAASSRESDHKRFNQ